MAELSFSQRQEIRRALEAVFVERLRQHAKWGEENHSSDRWAVVLGEEMGEACKALLENEDGDLLTELIQVAAVSIAWVECLNRRRRDIDVSKQDTRHLATSRPLCAPSYCGMYQCPGDGSCGCGICRGSTVSSQNQWGIRP